MGQNKKKKVSAHKWGERAQIIPTSWILLQHSVLWLVLLPSFLDIILIFQSFSTVLWEFCSLLLNAIHMIMHFLNSSKLVSRTTLVKIFAISFQIHASVPEYSNRIVIFHSFIHKNGTKQNKKNEIFEYVFFSEFPNKNEKYVCIMKCLLLSITSSSYDIL